MGARKIVKFTVVLCFILASVVSLSAEPTMLEDRDLIGITAGNNDGKAGGVVVGYGSQASLIERGSLLINMDAQFSAMGQNLVNSSGSAIVNGFNLWDGSDLALSKLNAAQLNRVEQMERTLATIASYIRSEEDLRFQVDTRREDDRSMSLLEFHEAKDLYIRDSNSTNDSVSSVDTSFEIGANLANGKIFDFFLESNVGTGIAASGQLDATYDAGSVRLGMESHSEISGKPGLSLGDFFSAEFELSFGTTLGLYAEIDLPTLTINMNGAGCGVVLGSCYSRGLSSDTIEETTDLSTFDSVEKQMSASHSFSETRIDEYRSPFSLGSAEAEYIVVDDSSLVYESDESLELTDSAQREARGVNVVNAVGSAIANVSNISRFRLLDYNGELTMTQFNYVMHGR